MLRRSWYSQHIHWGHNLMSKHVKSIKGPWMYFPGSTIQRSRDRTDVAIWEFWRCSWPGFSGSCESTAKLQRLVIGWGERATWLIILLVVLVTVVATRQWPSSWILFASLWQFLHYVTWSCVDLWGVNKSLSDFDWISFLETIVCPAYTAKIKSKNP